MYLIFTDVSIGSRISDSIGNGIVKFYSLPFPSFGITLALTVTSGYVNCYASDRYRNPNQYSYDWFVNVRNYWEVYIDPRDISRPVGSFLYIAIVGANATNMYQVNSSSGDTLTVGKHLMTNDTLNSSAHTIGVYVINFRQEKMLPMHAVGDIFSAIFSTHENFTASLRVQLMLLEK